MRHGSCCWINSCSYLGGAEHFCNLGETIDALIDYGHRSAGGIERTRPWVAGIVTEGDQRPEIVHGESDTTKPLEESDPFFVRAGVVPVSGWEPGGCRQDTVGFVEADGGGLESCSLAERSDSHGWFLARPDLTFYRTARCGAYDGTPSTWLKVKRSHVELTGESRCLCVLPGAQSTSLALSTTGPCEPTPTDMPHSAVWRVPPMVTSTIRWIRAITG